MVNTVKFSEFSNIDLNNSNNKTVGIDAPTGGNNIKIPLFNTWTTVGRPTIPYPGLLGYNTTLNKYEYWNGTTWIAVP